MVASDVERSPLAWSLGKDRSSRTEDDFAERRSDCGCRDCGWGFTGLSTALHLAEKGVNAVVLEGVEIGYGGSGRNVGLVNAGMWVMPDDLPGVLGQKYGDRLLDVLGNAPKLVFEIIENTRSPARSKSKGRCIVLSAQRVSRNLKTVTSSGLAVAQM